MRIKIPAFLTLLFFACVSITLAQASGEKPAITPKSNIVLFDGTSLDAFYTYLKSSQYSDPLGVFKIVDGQLRISGEDWGAITTRDRYRDYHLIVEWKWGGPSYKPRTKNARDSGILVHATGPDGVASGCWMESIECQVIEGGCGDIILVAGQGRPSLTVETRKGPHGQLYWKAGGTKVRRDEGRFNWYGRDPEWKDVQGYRGPQDVEKPTGEWNRSEVICDGDSITNLVNGVVVNHGTESSVTEGKIQFQSEGAEIIIRRIELRPVDKASLGRLWKESGF